MAAVRLYLDEDVIPTLALILRERGHDAVSALDLGRKGIADPDHFVYAAKEGRAILTYNVGDYIPLASEAMRSNTHFSGLILSTQDPLREILRRTLRLLRDRQKEQMDNSVVWLNSFR